MSKKIRGSGDEDEDTDGVTKNELDFIITDKKNSVEDVSVLNNCSIGSDHRIVWTKVMIYLRIERKKIVTKLYV